MGQSQSFPPVDYDTVTHFTSAATGRRIHSRSWMPEGEPRALVYFSHGASEHMEWYSNRAEKLNSVGVAAFGHDHVGHGRSEGDRGHVDDVSEYIDDMVQGIQQVKEQHPGLPMFLLGHSMGGLIAFITASRHPDIADYLVLSAPGFIVSSSISSPLLNFLARTTAAILPQVGFMKLKTESVSRDPAVLEAIDADPYFYRGVIKARFGVAMMTAQTEAMEQFESFSMPLLIYHGTGDELTLIDGSRQLYAAAKSEDKTMKEYDGGYHNLDREPEGMGEDVLQLLADWVVERAGQARPASTAGTGTVVE